MRDDDEDDDEWWFPQGVWWSDGMSTNWDDTIQVPEDFRFHHFGRPLPEETTEDVAVELTRTEAARETIAGWIHNLAMIVAPAI